MSCALLIGRYAVNVAGLADTVTASAGDADFPASYLYDGNVAKPAKLTTTTGDWVFDFGAAQRIDLVAFGPHNLTAGLTNVLFQGNATDSWGSPTLSATITIPAYFEDGQSVNPWKDLTGVAGYTSAGFRYWRLRVGTANGAPIAIGEVALYSEITSLRNFRIGVEDVLRIPAVVHSTLYEVDTVYHLGVARRQLVGDVVVKSSELSTLLTWYRGGAGRTQWHTMILEDDVNDARFVRFDGDALSFSRLGNSNHRIGLSFTEVSRGLYL